MNASCNITDFMTAAMTARQTVQEARNDLMSSIKQQNLDVDVAKIEEALNFAESVHNGQWRDSLDPFVVHPIAVAKLMVELHTDTTSIILGLLHDTVEDMRCSSTDVERMFGKQQAELVQGITKLRKIGAPKCDKEKQIENLRKLLLAVSKDIRVLLVKLADKVHNMRTLHFIGNPEKRTRIAQEVAEIYAPLAERIGLYKFKDELQDLAFAELHSEIRHSIMIRLDYLRQRKETGIEENVEALRQLLNSVGIQATVHGREKTPYSIWCKMEEKKVAFEKLSDIIAFRIIVAEVEDCYKTLMVLHRNFPAVPGGFQDHISTPKMNGYRSLHTIVIGPQKCAVEIQIRTHKMHEEDELGVAAHWYYKQRSGYDITYHKQYNWMKELQHILQNTTNPDAVLENTKCGMECNSVFCFSQKGDFIALPKQSTVIDYAFAIDTDLGIKCKGAMINGKTTPLQTYIENGDQVEILTSDKSCVSPSWEHIVTTEKAKIEIKRFLQTKQYTEFINIGRVLLIEAMRRGGRHYNEVKLLHVLPKFRKERIEDLLVDVGKGDINPSNIVSEIVPSYIRILYKLIYKKLNLLKVWNTFTLSQSNILQEVDVSDIRDCILGEATVHIADCCRPLPGEDVIGVMLSRKKVIMHLKNCEMVKNFLRDKKNVVQLFWSSEVGRLYTGRIRVTMINECGVLAAVTAEICRENINIQNIKISNKFMSLVDVILEVEVDSVDKFLKIMDRINRLSSVYDVRRE